MNLTLVFVVDPPSMLNPGHDSSVALMEVAQQRGHRVLVTGTGDLSVEGGAVLARCRPVRLRPCVLAEGRWVADPEWCSLGEETTIDLASADAVFMRVDPPVDRAYLHATYLLDLVDPGCTLMVNAPAGLQRANEKLFALTVPELMPATLVSNDPARIRALVTTWGRAVLKPVEGMAGRGILVLAPHDPNLGSLLETATERGRRHVVVQQWIAGVSDGDRRVVVLDGEPVGSVRRIATGPEFRCNMATGARVEADAVTPADRELCRTLSPHLRRNGLHLVGIDVIGGLLTEVNVTSPTGLREIEALSGERVAEQVVQWTERSCPRARRDAVVDA